MVPINTQHSKSLITVGFKFPEMKKSVLVLGCMALATVNAASKYWDSFVFQAEHMNINLKNKGIKVQENLNDLELNAYMRVWLIRLAYLTQT
jgi:hypothetical protein